MTDKAVEWVHEEKSLTPDKPFFIYFAPGATHAPAPVPKGWIEKIQRQVRSGPGQAARGNARSRKALGVVPADTPLAPKPEAIKDWDKLSAHEKRLVARQMEVFAGFGEYADTEIGRLVDAIRRSASSTIRSSFTSSATMARLRTAA